ncbi:hypothetical protein AMK21_25930 [Streptomyces sp. CB00316]|uniref:hypothetical protein n=1 Tax=Streptomyces sp. CB00316 TaxID=1703932 RepID=UPI0009404E8A|nr:hypothetical protein [Streptomyces sp. CB00316]OKJ17732.1 hypothetical protein AMK21_25930 [Streptomyces sp. CB00316]
MLVFQSATGSPVGSTTADAKPGPVKADTRTAPLRASGDGRSGALKQGNAKPFSMLGITWTDPAATVTVTLEVRTRNAGSGRSSSWLRLDGDTQNATA